jgi:hypothetical protein
MIRVTNSLQPVQRTEGVTPANAATTGQITAGETIYINIDSSDTVDNVSVRWQTGFRRKTWNTRDV